MCERMGLEEFSLMWEDHDKTLLGIFERLRESKTFVDCTITAEGQYLKAHKIMLSACSPYFELLFKQENEKNPIIIFKDIKFKELKAIVDFVYRGKVEISEDSLGDFVEAAESLQISGLRGDHGRKVPNQSPTLQRRESHVSCTTRKRKKKRLSLAEMSPGGLSSESDIDHESNISENVQIETVYVPSSQTQHADISMNRHSAAENTFCVDTSNVEIQPCTSYIQSAVLPTETLIEDVKNVIKTEPEIKKEIFVPESECLTNMSEECVEDTTLFDYDDENVSIQEHILNPETSNQYSALPYVTETANEDPGNMFEVPPEAINSQGHHHFTVIEDVKNEVKIEPDPKNEIPIQQSESLTNMSEECVEDTPFYYDHGNVSTKEHMLNHETSNQYSALPHVTETAHEDTDDMFEVPPEEVNSQGFGRAGNVASDHLQNETPGYFSQRLPAPVPDDPVAPSAVAMGARPRKKHSCPHCHKTFVIPSLLRRHLRVHTGEKPFECQTCHRAFSQRSSLNQHLATHTGEKPFKCQTCHRAFPYRSNLKMHLATHTGEKPFECETCHRGFLQRSDLKRHIIIHTGEKPFKCQMCHRAFADHSALNRHVTTHTGEKPHCCDVCGKRFTRSSYVTVHMRTHAAERDRVRTRSVLSKQ